MQELVKTNLWIFYIILTILGTAIVHVLVSRIIHHLINKAEKADGFILEALLKAMRLPLGFLIWLIGAYVACTTILTYRKDLYFFSNLSEIINIGIVFLLTWFLIRFIRRLEVFYLQQCSKNNNEVDKTLIHGASQLGTIVLLIIGILIILQILNVPVAGLLAFGGIGGAGVAFAAKDLLANFFGGLVIYMDRPFKVGDWIKSPDKNIEGIVEYIGWRVTRILTFDKRPLYVPNGLFLTISVENASRIKFRRIKTTVGLRYQDMDKIDAVAKQIKQLLMDEQSIDNKQQMYVSLVEFGASSLNILISAYCKIIKWDQFLQYQHEILLKILDIISKNGAECAFPTQTLFLQQSE